MMKFELWLGEDDVDRLFYLRQKNGKGELTGEQYAQELLEKRLYKLCPNWPEPDENGRYIIEPEPERSKKMRPDIDFKYF